MQVIAIRYVTYSRALCGSKKTLGDRIRKLKESLGYRKKESWLSNQAGTWFAAWEFGNRIESASC